MNRIPYRPDVLTDQDGRTYLHASGDAAEALVRILQPDDSDIRSMLAALRTRLGVSTGHLAAVLGVPRITLRKWMKGTRRPSAAAKRLVWFVHALTLDPTLLARPGTWLSWSKASP